jgi:hypothetical protein
MCKIYNNLESGYCAIVYAIFEQAREEVNYGPIAEKAFLNGDISIEAFIASARRARKAEDFLKHPDTRAALAEEGIDPQYYEKKINSPDDDAAAQDFERRVLALYDWGYSRSGICYVVWGTISKSYLRKVRQVLEAAAV